MDSKMDSLVSALEFIFTPSPIVFGVGIAIIILVPIILHLLLARATPYTALPTVLLVGPSGAGKTALLTLFERGPLVSAGSREKNDGSRRGDSKSGLAPAAQTHTSQVASAVELAVSEDRTSSFRDDLDASGSVAKKFLLVDTPGHGKLRNEALSRLTLAASQGGSKGRAVISKKNKAADGTIVGSGGKLRAVVFVVDAAALADDSASSSLAEAGEYLYDVLLTLQRRTGSGRTSRAPAAVPVLVAANKQDLFAALPASLVRSALENELGRVRKARSRALLDSGVAAEDEAVAGEEGDDWLGAYGTDKFTFAQMREFDIEVDILGGNVFGDGPGADKWWSWIADKI